MLKRTLLGLLVLVALLSACSSGRNSSQESTGSPVPGGTKVFAPLVPAPKDVSPAVDATNPNPDSAGPYPSGQSTREDTNMVEGAAFVDKSEIIQSDQTPGVELQIEGSLPTPCHILASEVGAPDSSGTIEVRVFSRVDPDLLCVQVLEPFEARIPLKDLKAGTYEVVVNGESVGEFTQAEGVGYP